MPSAVDVLRKQAILNPEDTIAAASAAGLPLAVMCAKLNRESRVKVGGVLASGQNVWGGDNVRGRGVLYTPGAVVTEQAYLRYRTERRAGRAGNQGVGPSQLTWHTFQDQADALGGCWIPRWNLQVGAAEMARCIKAGGGSLREAGAIYNSGKPYARAPEAAQEYGRWLEDRVRTWEALLRGATPSPATPPAGSSPQGGYLAEGDTGDYVQHVQRWFNTTFPAYARIDLAPKRYGPQTVAVVREFQRRAGVTGPDADGTNVGPRTLAAMRQHGFRP
ncbi:hypothetical protein GCM10009613_61360 [Pseudonocardia kongjuensis]|uniref:Peptidoglycan binding-like domain-containing protein n=1 Tax=Pseudonocardia kongjuensis TaxID=102227 RepID=A0ABN1Y9Z6_9PSEU